MNTLKLSGYFVIWITLYFALCLEFMNPGGWADKFWPLWSIAVIFYWVLKAPQYFGVISVFILGIVIDIAHGVQIGTSSISLVILTSLLDALNQRAKLSNRGAQTFLIFLATGAYITCDFFVKKASGQLISANFLYMPALSTAVCWHLLKLVFEKLGVLR